jgi:hypothetical protein
MRGHGTAARRAPVRFSTMKHLFASALREPPYPAVIRRFAGLLPGIQ